MRQHEEPQDLSPASIDRLRDLVEGMAVHQGPWSTTHGGEKTNSGVTVMPWVENGPLIEEALHFLYDNHLMIPFDWGRWDEGRAIFNSDDPNRFSTLDRLTVLKLLTAVARNDRFSPGAWAAFFDHGDGQELLHRLLDLETNPPDLA